MTQLLKELWLKGQKEIVVLNAPDTVWQELESLERITKYRDASSLKRVDYVLAFVTTDAELAAVAKSVLPKAQGDPMVLFAYPKDSSKRYKRQFDRKAGWAPIRAAGFKSGRQVSLDQDWSLIRFRRIEHTAQIFNHSKLLELRHQRGWSQSDLAGRASVIPNYISKLENGRVGSPDMLCVQKIADALEVPLTALMSVDRAPQLRVFICHAHLDKPAARELYQRLKSDGFAPWLDEEDLLPGQNWRKVIPKAVADAHVVVVCLSRTATNKQGFVQKEIGYALDVASEQPEDTIFIIPVRLEECVVPDRLSELQWVDLYEARGYERLLRSLRHRADSLQRTGDLP